MELVPYDLKYNTAFEVRNAKDVIDTAMPRLEEFAYKKERCRPPDDAKPEYRPAYFWPLLAKDQEQHLFRRMNFTKFCFNQDLTIGKVDNLDNYRRTVDEIQNLVFHCNMRLAIYTIKPRIRQNDVGELLSEAHAAIFSAIHKFDYALGNKFSTYATWAIRNACRRSPFLNASARFTTNTDVILSQLCRDFDYEKQFDNKLYAEKARALMGMLTDRERKVVEMRVGLYRPSPREEGVWSFSEIGNELDISKGRAQQIYTTACGIMSGREKRPARWTAC